MEADAEQVAEVPGIGPVLAGTIVETFAEPRNRELVERLRAAGLQMAVERAATDAPQPLAGQTFVLTGTLDGMSRERGHRAHRVAGRQGHRLGLREDGLRRGRRRARLEGRQGARSGPACDRRGGAGEAAGWVGRRRLAPRARRRRGETEQAREVERFRASTARLPRMLRRCRDGLHRPAVACRARWSIQSDVYACGDESRTQRIGSAHWIAREARPERANCTPLPYLPVSGGDGRIAGEGAAGAPGLPPIRRQRRGDPVLDGAGAGHVHSVHQQREDEGPVRARAAVAGQGADRDQGAGLGAAAARGRLCGASCWTACRSGRPAAVRGRRRRTSSCGVLPPAACRPRPARSHWRARAPSRR